MDGNPLEEVDTFTYLGANIDKGGLQRGIKGGLQRDIPYSKNLLSIEENERLKKTKVTFIKNKTGLLSIDSFHFYMDVNSGQGQQRWKKKNKWHGNEMLSEAA